MLCLFPGSFDPPTLGHKDMILRSAKLCDKLIILLLNNCKKKYLYPVEKRMEMLERITAGMDNIEIRAFDGMLVDFAAEVGADAVIRGIRNEQDYAYERDMAYYNRELGNVETIFLPSKMALAAGSSSGVREVLLFGKSAEGFVPEEILELL